MARRGDVGHLFIGRLNKNTRTRDLEEIFEAYGRIARCEIKYGERFAILQAQYLQLTVSI